MPARSTDRAPQSTPDERSDREKPAGGRPIASRCRVSLAADFPGIDEFPPAVGDARLAFESLLSESGRETESSNADGIPGKVEQRM
jgi:hypothetical protein